MQTQFDVIVVGGGISGTLCAISAAREGKRVLLLEKYGFLGGAATNALVNPFMPYRTAKYRVNNAGLFQTLLDRLEKIGGLHKNKAGFNEQLLMILLDQMAQEAGVTLLFHAQAAEAAVTDGRVTALTALGMSGQRLTFTAEVFVDATGDAELLQLSGCPYRVGRDEDGKCQPMTTCFRIGHIDKERLRTYAATTPYRVPGAYITAMYNEKQRSGEIINPRENVLMFDHSLPDAIHFNTTRILGRSSLDTVDYTQAELEGRRQVYEMYTFLKHQIVGYEDCVLIQIAPQIGVRESRRLVGAYTLTREDVLGCVKFPDAIARGCYDIDVHNPSGTGTEIMHLPENEYYTIPMRSLWNPAFSNLIVTGRPISSDHAAHSSLRVMPIGASIGEAAGILAAQAVGRMVSNVPYTEVQARLKAYDALY